MIYVHECRKIRNFLFSSMWPGIRKCLLMNLESKAFGLIEAQEQLIDQQSIVLYAGTNVINPKVAKKMLSSIYR